MVAGQSTDLLDVMTIESSLSLQLSYQTISSALFSSCLAGCTLEGCPEADLKLPQTEHLQALMTLMS